MTTATPVPPKKSGFKKFLRIFLIVSILIIGIIIWWNYFYVFGEGVKSGELNYVVKKGNIFKTYEGKLIQSGIRSKTVGAVQSYEFEFSVADDSIANTLMNNSGKYILLFSVAGSAMSGSVAPNPNLSFIITDI